MLRAFAESAVAFGLSWFVLFLDLSKALDFAVRETVMGWMQCSNLGSMDEKARHLEKFGVPSELTHDLAAWIEESGGLLSSSEDVAGNAQAMINSLHDKAWFRLDKDECYIQTSAGGRQGCILGPVVLNLIYSIALRRTTKILAGKGLLVRIRCRDALPFWASAGTTWEWAAGATSEDAAGDLLFEITFVDDVAAMLSAPSAAALLEVIPVFVCQLCFVLRSLGFVVNCAEGKTEAFVSFRGKQSAEFERQLATKGHKIELDPACGASELRLVKLYKHLGSMLDDSMRHHPDVEVRIQRAMGAYAPIASKVFGAREIARQVRLRLFFALVVSRLVYNVHVWGALPNRHYKRLNACYMRGLRMIAGRSRYSRESAMQASDHDVRLELQAMSLQCVLIRRRLLLLSQIVRHGNPQLHRLLCTSRRDGSKLAWVQAVLADMQIIFANCKNKLADLGPPDSNAESWWKFIHDFPLEWRALVKSLHLTSMSLDEVSVSRHLDCSHVEAHRCSYCDRTFPSDRALLAHTRTKHRTFSEPARFVGRSLRCPICFTKFTNRPRLVAHLVDKRSRGKKEFTCNAVLCAGFVKPADEQEFSEVCLADRILRKEARKRGLTQPRADTTAKRLRVGSSVSAAALACVDDKPSNMLAWSEVPPAKRLRRKTSLDTIMSHWISR